ncbi:MAG TPA: hypothetical protein VM328_05175 [Fimbriimonadaceae bacterium]|nr:hypothetical protein [Fimbriimonadaceae bacterium]
MKRLCWTGLCVVALLGCGPATPEQVQVTTPSPPKLREKPDFEETRLGILMSPDDPRKLKVGDSGDDSLRLFPASSGARTVNELPAAIGSPYRVKGWEDKAGGFAAILYDGRVALAMRKTTTDESDLERTLEAYAKDLGPALVVGAPPSRVDYWFWEEEGHRLMLNVLRTRDGATMLTEAVGTQAIMNSIGADATSARRQRAQAEAEVRKQIGAPHK